MKAVVTGATGLVGKALLERLEAPIVLSRDVDRARTQLGANVVVHAWRPESDPAPRAALAGADVVFHLAGENVADGRWTAEKKRRIRDSRVLGTRQLVAGLTEAPPRVLVSASAIGYYGEGGDRELDESSAPGSGFLAEVCAEWEAEADAAARLGVRVVKVRVGIVLARQGGALERMLPPFRLGAGGRLGDGRQWMSWVHVDDLVGLMLAAARMQSFQGPLNGVGPAPVRNADFTRVLGRVLHRPALFGVPGVALRVAFGELGSVLLGSLRVLPARASELGYSFVYPELEAALRSCV